MHYSKAASVADEALSGVKTKVSMLEPKQGAINSARSEIAKRVAETAPLLEAVSDREYWIRVIDDINSRLPEKYIWITEFSPPTEAELQKGAKPADTLKKGAPKPKADAAADAAPEVNITISGLILENPRKFEVLDDFIKNLEGSPYVATPKESEKFTREQRNDVWASKFSFPLRLKNPISLK